MGGFALHDASWDKGVWFCFFCMASHRVHGVCLVAPLRSLKYDSTVGKFFILRASLGNQFFLASLLGRQKLIDFVACFHKRQSFYGEAAASRAKNAEAQSQLHLEARQE